MSEVNRNVETSHFVDSVVSECYDANIVRLSDLDTALTQAAKTDAIRLRELSKEMEQYAEAHHRYLALRKYRDAHERSLRGRRALLGTQWIRAINNPPPPSNDLGREATLQLGQGSDTFALWEHMRELLRVQAEARINEILSYFAHVGLHATPQAIDAAVRTHPKVFGVRKRGREKFIVLREQEND